jgi:hypothetical protein
MIVVTKEGEMAAENVAFLLVVTTVHRAMTAVAHEAISAIVTWMIAQRAK